MVVPRPPNPVKDSLLLLMAEKETMEAKINEYGFILRRNGNVGMHGNLIDENGFPRSDIDVYKVRLARQRIICLQNDHKELMKNIHEHLRIIHSQASDEEKMEIAQAAKSLENGGTHIKTVIAYVNLLSPGSPAEEAGLRVGDGIIEFGSLNSITFNNNLLKVRDVAEDMRNRQVRLIVKRDGKAIELCLIPKAWKGRGLLGCNIVLPTDES